MIYLKKILKFIFILIVIFFTLLYIEGIKTTNWYKISICFILKKIDFLSEERLEQNIITPVFSVVITFAVDLITKFFTENFKKISLIFFKRIHLTPKEKELILHEEKEIGEKLNFVYCKNGYFFKKYNLIYILEYPQEVDCNIKPTKDCYKKSHSSIDVDTNLKNIQNYEICKDIKSKKIYFNTVKMNTQNSENKFSIQILPKLPIELSYININWEIINNKTNEIQKNIIVISLYKIFRFAKKSKIKIKVIGGAS